MILETETDVTPEELVLIIRDLQGRGYKVKEILDTKPLELVIQLPE